MENPAHRQRKSNKQYPQSGMAEPQQAEPILPLIICNRGFCDFAPNKHPISGFHCAWVNTSTWEIGSGEPPSLLSATISDPSPGIFPVNLEVVTQSTAL